MGKVHEQLAAYGALTIPQLFDRLDCERKAHIAGLKEAEQIIKDRMDPRDKWSEAVALNSAAVAIRARIVELEVR